MKYDTPITRKTNRAKKKKFNENLKYITLLAVIIVTQLINTGNDNAIMIMLTDIADQGNYIRQEVETPDIDTENRSQVNSESLTGEAREIVERVVASESRGEDLQGMMAVAQVIKDRSDLWDMHPVDAVLAEGQFAKPYDGEISDEIHLAVANVFDGGVRVFEEPVTHFYSGAEPYWADEKIDRGGIGCHEFLY